MELGSIDIAVFVLYFVVLIGIGIYAGRKGEDTSEGYFLAGRSLPWYVAGTSFIGSNISTEHFIGMVGAAYIYGICVATAEWGNVFAFSVLIWFFIPFLLASKVFTIPEFLEKRYNSTCRLLFAVLTVVANITAFLAAVLYAAALGLQEMFGWDIWTGVIVMAVSAGSYSIFGGLRSVAWTDLFQTIVMIIGGLMVTFLGLSYLGDGAGIFAGWETMIERNLGMGDQWTEAIQNSAQKILGGDSYNRLSVFQPMNHPLTPWATLFVNWLAISIWYNCINQMMIQRVLAAKDDWHARMGIVMAMFMKIFLPFIVVIPGLIYFAMEPNLTGKDEVDKIYPTMVNLLISVGLKGLLLAALFGAIQSTVDSVLNSTSTVITLDIYKKFIRPDANDKSLVRSGKWISASVLVIGVLLAPQIAYFGEGIFMYIQNLFAHFAPPFAAIFLVGILYKRVNGKGAVATIISGMLFSILLEYVIFPRIDFALGFPIRSFLVWSFCVTVLIVVSLATEPPKPEKVTPDLVANWGSLQIFKNLGSPWYKNLLLWYSIGAIGMISCFIIFSGLF